MPTHDISDFPPLVQNFLKNISETERDIFSDEYDRRTAEIPGAYTAWVLLGSHYAYLGKWVIQLLFWFTAGGFFLWWLFDLAAIPSMVKKYNEETSMQVMRDMKA